MARAPHRDGAAPGGPAPFYAEVADAPADLAAHWLTTADGVRLRVAICRPDPSVGPAAGTVLLFPGRTEYIEKYGPAARAYQARGFAFACLDWRGQGLADRLMRDPVPGHIGRFADYQHDVQALLAFVRAEGLPEPYFLVAHSMGGCIGLRALHAGLPVRAAAFSGPMWGIGMKPAMRCLARILVRGARWSGLSGRLVPTTARETYVLTAGFDDNMLTRDAQMYDFMQRQSRAHPDLVIGGPTLHWLDQAMRETAALAALPAPQVPCLTMVGGAERIVSVPAIHAQMARWPEGRLETVAAAEHEIMMEVPATRTRFFDATAAHFIASAAQTAPGNAHAVEAQRQGRG